MQRAAPLSPLSEEARDTHVEPLRARVLPGRECNWDPLQATVTDDLTDVDYKHYINRSTYRKGYSKDDPLYAYLKPKCEPPVYDDRNKLKWKHKMADISPEKDGGILKMVISKVQDRLTPFPDDLVSIIFTAYVKHCNIPFDSTVMRQRPYVFPLRVGAVVDSLRVAVASMQEGEIGRFLFKPSHFVRLFPEGLGDIVPAESDVIFDIQLVHISNDDPHAVDYYAMSLEARKDAPVMTLLKVALTEQNKRSVPYFVNTNNWILHCYTRSLTFVDIASRSPHDDKSKRACKMFCGHVAVNAASNACKLGYFESSLKYVVKTFRIVEAYMEHRHDNKIRCYSSYTSFGNKLLEVAQYCLELSTSLKYRIMFEIRSVLLTIINHEKGVSGSKCQPDQDSYSDASIHEPTNPSEIVGGLDHHGIEISEVFSLQQTDTTPEWQETDTMNCESDTTAELFEPQWDNVDDVDHHKPHVEPAVARELERARIFDNNVQLLRRRIEQNSSMFEPDVIHYLKRHIGCARYIKMFEKFRLSLSKEEHVVFIESLKWAVESRDKGKVLAMLEDAENWQNKNCDQFIVLAFKNLCMFIVTGVHDFVLPMMHCSIYIVARVCHLLRLTTMPDLQPFVSEEEYSHSTTIINENFMLGQVKFDGKSSACDYPHIY